MSRRKRPPRPRAEIVQSVRRLKGEELIPVAVIAAERGVSVGSVVRWIVEGKGGGRYLDGVHEPARGWVTSREAVGRFTAAT